MALRVRAAKSGRQIALVAVQSARCSAPGAMPRGRAATVIVHSAPRVVYIYLLAQETRGAWRGGTAGGGEADDFMGELQP